MSTYAIYTYEFERILSKGKQLVLEGFPVPGCSDEDWNRKQEIFRGFFKKGAPLAERTFQSGQSTFVYDTIFDEGHIAIMKMGRLSKRNVTDVQLNDHTIEDYPWCYVIWDNRDGIQRMLIEQKPSAWTNTKTLSGTKKVAKALKLIIDDWLLKRVAMHFSFGDGPVYKASSFWDCVKRFPQGFTRVHFSFPPLNLPRLLELGDNLNQLRKETGGGVDAELKASKGGTLTLSPENPQTSSLVNLNAACGSEVKAYPKGSNTMIRISGDNLDNDIVVEVPNELIPILTSPSLFNTANLNSLVEILNGLKTLY